MVRHLKERVLDPGAADLFRWIFLFAGISAAFLLLVSCDKDGPIEVDYTSGGVSLQFVFPDSVPDITSSITAEVRINPDGMAAYEETIIITRQHGNRPLEVPVETACVITVILDHAGVTWRGSVAVPPLSAGSSFIAGVHLLEPGTEPVFRILTPDTVATSRNIRLALYGPGADKMRITNVPAMDSLALDTLVWEMDWVDHDSLPEWILPTGAGMKYIFAQVAFLNGDTSAILIDSVGVAGLTGDVVIMGDSVYTAYRNVTLTMNAPGASEMMITRIDGTDDGSVMSGKRGKAKPDKSGIRATSSEWIPYVSSYEVELPTGEGLKWVEVAFRNEFLIEAVAGDTISTKPIDGSISIQTDEDIVNYTAIPLELEAYGAIDMKIGLSQNSSDIDWEEFQSEYTVDLPQESGWHTVYVWLRNDFLTLGPYRDSVGVDLDASIQEFTWTSSSETDVAPGDTVYFNLLADSAFYGQETGGLAEVAIQGLSSRIQLEDQADGSYTGSWVVRNSSPQLSSATITGYFTDVAGNVANSYMADETLSGGGLTAGTMRSFPLGNSGLQVQMVWIPPGNFQMGAQSGEVGADLDETPVHDVTFAYGFWMSRSEMTQSQYEAVMGSGNVFPEFPGSSRPVENVSFGEARILLTVLNSGESQQVWRMPTEAEWEYAARAGSDTRFPWGDDSDYSELGGYAWFTDNSNNTTHYVRGRDANSWGLYDMFGNVWEYCQDWYHDSYTGAPEDGSAWNTPSGSERVIRGGSWNDAGAELRSASRDSRTETERSGEVGIRLVHLDR